MVELSSAYPSGIAGTAEVMVAIVLSAAARGYALVRQYKAMPNAQPCAEPMLAKTVCDSRTTLFGLP